MLKAAMKTWMERKPEEELLIEEVGVIAGGGPGCNKGQVLHSDVSAPEDFALGALMRAPLPLVFKESGVGSRASRLQEARKVLGLDAAVALSPASPIGPEVARYFGARLLVMDYAAMTLGINTPWPTTNPKAPLRTYLQCAEIGDVALIPGGTPHHGPPCETPLLRVFFLCRRYGTASPYQGYSQIYICETELFFACLSPTDNALLEVWERQMTAYAAMFEYHNTIVENSPLAKVLNPLALHLDWLLTQSIPDADFCAIAEGTVQVLEKAMGIMKANPSFAKLKWRKWVDNGSNAGRAMQADWQRLRGMRPPPPPPPLPPPPRPPPPPRKQSRKLPAGK